MRKLIAMALVLCMLLSLVPAAVAAETGMTKAEAEAAVETLNANSDFYYELVDNYAKPDIEYRSEVRWWMAEGGHTDETLIEEVQAMYDAGFRGVELCQLNVGGMDAATWGYGSEQWNHDFHLVLNKALDLGMTIGMTSGTNWNTSNVPGLDPDSEAAMQCVYQLNETLAAGASRTGALPTHKNLREKATFIGAYAYKKAVSGNETKAIELDPEVIINLTDKVVLNEDNRTGTLEWIAPEDGEYIVMYYWKQATAQASSPSVVPSYCINYFDIAGLEALKEYWLANVLNDPALNEKIKNGDVQLFMDSLEYSTGSGFTNWTVDFADEFLARKGYDITPYLILAVGLPQPKIVHPTVEPYGTYNFTDAELGQQILNDLNDVQTQLYMEEMMTPFEEWLNEYGIELRAQISYGKYIENSEPIMSVDYPEAETLNQENQIEMYRTWSGGSKLQNKVLSSETSALGGTSYAYSYQWHLKEAYTLFAAGFSRINWHIWTSQWAPKSVNVTWPGFRSMSNFNVLSLRYPSYDDYAEFNDHLGRVQQLLREGESRTDLGLPYTKYGMPILAPSRFSRNTENNWLLRHDWMTGYIETTELQDNGYTYDYFSPDFLTAEDVYFDVETQTIEQAGYKALVIWQSWLDYAGAQKILEWAKQGLEVVIVDGAAEATPYNDGKAEALAAVMAELKTLDTVRVAPTADDVMEALLELGVTPYAAMEENRQLLTQVRQDGENKFLYVYNYCDNQFCEEDHGIHIATEIAVEGTFVPYFIDAWTGEVVKVGEYRWEDGRTVIEVDLNYGDVALYAFEAVETEPDHVVASELETYVTEDGIVIRATETGAYETELAYGRTVKTDVEVPASFDITGWDLTVESWTEGEEITRTDSFTDSKGNTSVEHTISTVKTNIPVKLDKLTTWDNIPEVGKEVSGKGYYSAKFNWDGEADGAYIDFGTLVMGMEVKINGVKTHDVNMNVPVLDIGDYLVEGENTIEIEYSSHMQNVIIKNGGLKITAEGKWTSWPGYRIDWCAYGPAQAVVIPYVEETVAVLESNDVTVSVNAAAEAVLNSEAAFEIAVSGAEALATATLTVETNGLTDAAIVPAEGWTVFAETEEDGALTVVMGNYAGINGEAVIATVTGKVEKIGAASVEVTEATLSAYVGEGETFVNAIIGEAGETAVVYSPYDVNQDGTVNQLDITRAQRFFGKADDLADVNDDGTVDITDFVLILNNYSK